MQSPSKLWLSTFVHCIVLCSLICPICGTWQRCPADDLQHVADKFAEDASVPGAWVAIAEQGKRLRIAAAGVRKAGESVPVTANDKIHLGSCTKAITATLMARLVERGLIQFESTLIEVMPELKDEVHAAYHNVTLEQLLTHHSGMPANAKNWWMDNGAPVSEVRLKLAKTELAEPPINPPGTKEIYSNFGYMIAGLMAEKVGGKSWEELVDEEVFVPMKLTSAGFGPPGTGGSMDQPWGHILESPGKLAPLQHDNAPVMGPAGTVHMQISDWAKFVIAHATDGRSLAEKNYLKPITWQRLHKPFSGESAFGWYVTQRPWAGGPAYTHSGSNTMWYCTVWVAPRQRRAYFVATNAGGESLHQLVDSQFGSLIRVASARR